MTNTYQSWRVLILLFYLSFNFTLSPLSPKVFEAALKKEKDYDAQKELITDFISGGGNINSRLPSGQTILTYAIIQEYFDLAYWLLDFHPHLLNVLDAEDNHPLVLLSNIKIGSIRHPRNRREVEHICQLIRSRNLSIEVDRDLLSPKIWQWLFASDVLAQRDTYEDSSEPSSSLSSQSSTNSQRSSSAKEKVQKLPFVDRIIQHHRNARLHLPESHRELAPTFTDIHDLANAIIDTRNSDNRILAMLAEIPENVSIADVQTIDGDTLLHLCIRAQRLEIALHLVRRYNVIEGTSHNGTTYRIDVQNAHGNSVVHELLSQSIVLQTRGRTLSYLTHFITILNKQTQTGLINLAIAIRNHDRDSIYDCFRELTSKLDPINFVDELSRISSYFALLALFLDEQANLLLPNHDNEKPHAIFLRQCQHNLKSGEKIGCAIINTILFIYFVIQELSNLIYESSLGLASMEQDILNIGQRLSQGFSNLQTQTHKLSESSTTVIDQSFSIINTFLSALTYGTNSISQTLTHLPGGNINQSIAVTNNTLSSKEKKPAQKKDKELESQSELNKKPTNKARKHTKEEKGKELEPPLSQINVSLNSRKNNALLEVNPSSSKQTSSNATISKTPNAQLNEQNKTVPNSSFMDSAAAMYGSMALAGAAGVAIVEVADRNQVVEKLGSWIVTLLTRK